MYVLSLDKISKQVCQASQYIAILLEKGLLKGHLSHIIRPSSVTLYSSAKSWFPHNVMIALLNKTQLNFERAILQLNFYYLTFPF